MKLYKSTDRLVSENYPWGFRLKTTKTDWLEFKAGRGFRHMSQTVDPKTGRECKPKAGVYYDMMLLGKDEANNHTVSRVWDFYKDEDVTSICDFLSVPDNFQLFTPEQITHIYGRLFQHLKVTISAQATYCGSKVDDLLPLFDAAIKSTIKGYKEKGSGNYFDEIKKALDWEKINSLKVEGYQPFKVVQHGSISTLKD